MRLTFDPPRDNQVHTYCMRCAAEAVTHHPGANPQKIYRCSNCGHNDGRAVIIDPAVTWWLDSTKEYWHETAAVFVGDGDKFLFFKRVKYPAGLITVPAGHRDQGEDPQAAALRELREETALKASRLTHIATENIPGDACRRGSDAHRWYIYATTLPSRSTVKVNSSEGSQPVWLTLKEALGHQLVPAVRHIITRYVHTLDAAVK